MFLNACKSKRLSTEKILVLDKTLNIQLNFVNVCLFVCFFLSPRSLTAECLT